MGKRTTDTDLDLYYGYGTICSVGAAIGHLCLSYLQGRAEKIIGLLFGVLLVAAGIVGGLRHLELAFPPQARKRTDLRKARIARTILFIQIGMVLFFLRSWVGTLTMGVAVWILFRLEAWKYRPQKDNFSIVQ